MDRLQQVIDALKRFQAEGDSIVQSILRDNEHIIIDMNAQNQLFERGIDSRGIELRNANPYSPITQKIKQFKRQPFDRVTLRDTGDFHRSFEVIFTQEGFIITANDIKTEKLIDKYGEHIFGLTAENLKELQEDYVAPELSEILKKWLNS